MVRSDDRINEAGQPGPGAEIDPLQSCFTWNMQKQLRTIDHVPGPENRLRRIRDEVLALGLIKQEAYKLIKLGDHWIAATKIFAQPVLSFLTIQTVDLQSRHAWTRVPNFRS
ncbi:hypothetical protein GCM10010990_06760 [Croceicoccus mobilis]|uniref:Uncharacterized protein n=1 Tax=Croceicoccus mobilis TaxID=1703339 RepID=A0A917DRG0_9SPHN|nr:hypothetical protein GCM10010990_06760 [Croceicoccus mobilis]